MPLFSFGASATIQRDVNPGAPALDTTSGMSSTDYRNDLLRANTPAPQIDIQNTPYEASGRQARSIEKSFFNNMVAHPDQFAQFKADYEARKGQDSGFQPQLTAEIDGKMYATPLRDSLVSKIDHEIQKQEKEAQHAAEVKAKEELRAPANKEEAKVLVHDYLEACRKDPTLYNRTMETIKQDQQVAAAQGQKFNATLEGTVNGDHRYIPFTPEIQKYIAQELRYSDTPRLNVPNDKSAQTYIRERFVSEAYGDGVLEKAIQCGGPGGQRILNETPEAQRGQVADALYTLKTGRVAPEVAQIAEKYNGVQMLHFGDREDRNDFISQKFSGLSKEDLSNIENLARRYNLADAPPTGMKGGQLLISRDKTTATEKRERFLDNLPADQRDMVKYIADLQRTGYVTDPNDVALAQKIIQQNAEARQQQQVAY